jgi:hypothetical protein
VVGLPQALKPAIFQTMKSQQRKPYSVLLVAEISIASACSAGSVAVSQDTSNDAQSVSSDAAPANDGARDAETSTLQWYTTCGDPVCSVPLDGGLADAALEDDAGTACPSVGSGCSTEGQTCGTSNPLVECGATEVCSDHDPKLGVGGCPISSREAKDHIEYIDDAQLQRLHDETMRIRLATYNYKEPYSDPTPKHLGFIIEDNPSSHAVDAARERVDLYGYISMVVATMQVEEKEIAKLRRELSKVRSGPCDGRSKSEGN